EAERIADGEHELTGPQRARIARRGGVERSRVHAKRGEIAPRVTRRDLGAIAAAVPQLDLRFPPAGHMRVGENQAARPDHTAAAASLMAAVRVDLHRRAPEFFGDFSEPAHGQLLRGRSPTVIVTLRESPPRSTASSTVEPGACVS